MPPTLNQLERKPGKDSKRVFVAAFGVAIALHILLGLLFYSHDFGPKAYVVDNSRYRVSLSNTVPQPNPESLIEPLTNVVSDDDMSPSDPVEAYPVKAKPVKAEQVKATTETTTRKQPPTDELSDPPSNLPTVPPSDPAQTVESVSKKVVSTVKTSRIKTAATPEPVTEKVVKQAAESATEPLKNADSGEKVKVSTGMAEAQTQHEDTPPKSTSLTKSTPKTEPPTEQFRSPAYELGSPNNPRPPYPSMAARRGWEGDVVLGVYVDAEGKVTYVEILETSNVSALDFAAYSTVYEEWRFSAADAHEINLRGYVRVPISFRK